MHQIQSSSHSRREFLGTAALLMARAAFAGSPQQAQVTTFIGTGRRGVAAEGDAIDRTNLDNPFFAIIGPDGRSPRGDASWPSLVDEAPVGMHAPFTKRFPARRLTEAGPQQWSSTND